MVLKELLSVSLTWEVLIILFRALLVMLLSLLPGAHSIQPSLFLFWFLSEVLFLIFQKAEGLKSKCWLIWFSMKALFLACRQPPYVSLLAEWENKLSCLFTQGQKSYCGSHTFMTSWNPKYLPKAPCPHTTALVGRASRYEFWEDTNNQSIILLPTKTQATKQCFISEPIEAF